MLKDSELVFKLKTRNVEKLKLSDVDRSHLQAAEGWLALGSWAEANEELENITPTLRAHPEVLFMRTRVYAAAERWTVVLELLDKVTDFLPKRVDPWLLWARAYAELGDSDMALETLSSVVDEFDQYPEVHYQMARYAAGAGDLKRAYTCLMNAFERSGDGRWTIKRWSRFG